MQGVMQIIWDLFRDHRALPHMPPTGDEDISMEVAGAAKHLDLVIITLGGGRVATPNQDLTLPEVIIELLIISL